MVAHRVGSVLAGRYQLVRPLGSGGMADAYVADDRVGRESVALKVLRLPDVGAVERFRNEFARLSGLGHPNLIRVRDLGVDRTSEPVHFYTSDLVDGVTLGELARTVGPRQSRSALLDALHALAFLHTLGIRHGDFKPDNVLVDDDGRGVLIDLGCGAAIGAASTDVSGTPRYMAPEVIGAAPADARADLYSVGTVLGELELADARVVERFTAPEASDRPADAAEALEILGDHRPILRAPAGRAPRLLGREAELGRFRTQLDALSTGTAHPRVSLLNGPAGIGKSRLLAELKWIAQRSFRVVEGASQGPAPVHHVLAAADVEVGSGLEGVLDAIERLRAANAPVVLVIDGAETLGPTDRRCLDALVNSVEPTDPVLVVVAGHDGEAVTVAERFELEPLDGRALTEWSRGLIDPRRVDDLLRRTRGVPARVESVLARIGTGELVETRLADAAPSSDAILGDLGSSTPADIEQLALLAALDGELAPALADEVACSRLAERGLVRRTAGSWILSDPGSVSALENVLPEPAVESARRRALEMLDGRQPLLSGDRARLVFLRARTGDVPGASDAARQGSDADFEREPRRWVRAAEAVARATENPEVLVTMARVLDASGHPERALKVLAATLRTHHGGLDAITSAGLRHCAGSSYAKLGRSRLAIRQLEEAHRLAPSAEVASSLARALIQQGDYGPARDLGLRAIEGCDDEAVRSALAQSIGICASYLGDDAMARQHLGTAAQGATVRDRIRSLSYLAILEFRSGRLGAAIEGYQRALELAEAHDVSDTLPSVIMNLGTALQQTGEWGQATDQYERALRFARALGRTTTVATLELNRANLFAEIGLFERAATALERASQAARDAGLGHLESTLHVVRGEIAQASERLEDARAHFSHALDATRARGAKREEAEVLTSVAALDVETGDVEAAFEHIERVLALAGDADDVRARAEALRGKARLASGDPRAAMRALQAAHELGQSGGQPLLVAEIEAGMAAVFDSEGAPGMADEQRGRARRAWERIATSLPAAMRDAFWQHPKRASLKLEPSRTQDHDWLSRFLEVNRRINSSLSVDRVLEYAMDAAIELSGAERGFVVLVDPTQRRRSFDVAVARNLDRERIGRSNFKFSRSIAEQVVHSGEPVVTTDAQSDARFAGQRSVHAMRLKSVVCVPITTPEGTLGALYLDNRFQRSRFSSDVLQLLTAFSNQVAIALTNARLVADLERRRAELASEKADVERVSRGQAQEIRRLNAEVETRQRALELRFSYDQIAGRSEPMRRVLETVDRVIDSTLTVLIQGESGTGKELVARAVHFNSPRKERPFVGVNCAALSEALLESELFGHAKGAFTGADRDKEGLMVAAGGGTLFLDEIGEMPLTMQVKLLRALQEREVRPLGANEVIPLDVRVVCATNRDLRREVAEGRFREDLFYRLGVVEVTLPPLRERAEDIPVIATTILERQAEAFGLGAAKLAPAAERLLLRQAWPGNIRELENAIAKAYVLSDRQTIQPGDFELSPQIRTAPKATDRGQFEQGEASRIFEALQRNRWNVSRVARDLGMPRNTLYRKLRKYRIERPPDAG